MLLFWVICIAAGKVGKAGRTFQPKEHATTAKTLQFALRQVNAKIIQGYVHH